MTAALLVLLLSAMLATFAAAADGALLSLDPGPDTDPRLVRLLEEREPAHRALSFARLLCYLSAGAAAGVLGNLGLDSNWRIQVIVATAVVVAAGAEAAARAAGDAIGSRAAVALCSFVSAMRTIAAPIVAFSVTADNVLTRLIPPPPPDEETREATAEQFREVVAAEADVTRDEAALLSRVFSLGETEVRDVMIPRVDIVGIERDAPWSEVIARVRSSEHARLPVYEESIDAIEGILYAKDLLPSVVADEQPDDWRSLIRQAVFIPPSKRIDDQLREFRATGTHIAIVADEYGGTAGLVTIEDVLEELVGEIRDEYDVESPEITQEDGRRYWVKGGVTVEELSDLLDHDFSREGVTTVGGLIYTLLGRVPRSGEALVIDGFRVVVERVVKRRIERVFFERPDSTELDDDDDDVEDDA